MKKIVVVVEEVEVARTALQWALHNLINYDDLIILLHVFQSSSPTKVSSSSSSSSSRHSTNNHNNKKQRVLRLKGFQLALSFKLICDDTIPDAKVDIAVREGDQDGNTIASTVREMGASALVVGIHDQSFLYKMARTNTTIITNINCRILAIKQPMESTSTTSMESSMNFDFSQIEIGRLSLPPVPPPQKIPYQILPSPFRIIWRSKRRRKEHQHQQNCC